jgi:N-acyl-D-amino-acid deacylase
MIDLLILNGTVIDGSGNPGYKAAIAVEGDAIRVLRGEVGHVEAGRRIDATGCVVAPGFIDMHSHSPLMILANPAHAPKVHQGVTTEVIGVDGHSYAPFARREDLLAFVEMNSGLEGSPAIDYDWSTVTSYLSRYDRKVAVNIALLVGNSALRISALGWDDVPANPEAIAQMRSLLREAMEEGAFGLSTGLDYPPGVYATTEELSALAAETARWGGIYHTHVRYTLGDRFLDPYREALEIGRRSGAPVHITHLFRRVTSPGGVRQVFDLFEAARTEGLDVTFDTFPEEYGGSRIIILLPLWAQAGGPAKLKARLMDQEVRPKLREYLAQRVRAYRDYNPWAIFRVGNFSRPENLHFEGMTLAEIADARGGDAADVLCDLLVEENLGVVGTWRAFAGLTMPPILAHDLAMVGTDSIFLGNWASIRTYGVYPRILGEFVRDERILSLPEAIRKMTSYPAQRLGILDRGLLRDGMKADIVVFDPVTIKSAATYEAPPQYPVGIHYVAVNGQLVVDQGQCTALTPGRALQRGR